MKRQCEVCGREYEAQRATSKVCGSTCRTRKARQPKQAADPAAAASTAVVVSGDGLVAATQARLAKVERDQSVLGSLALMLATRLESAGVDTGSSIASLSRELRATLAAAEEGVKVETDLVDELEERRARKLAGLSG